MRDDTKNKLLLLLFGGFLLAMCALFLFGPKETFSPREKRFLAGAPDAELGEILSGRFGRQAEDWAADHLPGRDFFLNLGAEADYWENLQVTKEIYRGKSGRLYESPAAYDEAEIRRLSRQTREPSITAALFRRSKRATEVKPESLRTQ